MCKAAHSGSCDLVMDEDIFAQWQAVPNKTFWVQCTTGLSILTQEEESQPEVRRSVHTMHIPAKGSSSMQTGRS